uniref:RED-like N-terminal domain-containing protein n=1 Tax=Physcomitrium patens TaxID=3218 RepID=A0A7I4BV17_PHYPA
MREENAGEDANLPRYRDRAKERREDINPDYDHTSAELGSLHALGPPGTADMRLTDAHRISIENSKFLGGDVEHTHLVKGLDFALLHKVRSEIDKEPENEDPASQRQQKEDQTMAFRTATAKMVYQWICKPQTVSKVNSMFLPGRTAFVFDMDGEFAHDIPTTVHRSKADCPPPQETVTVGVDGTVLERIAKIMTYLRLGAGKPLKKKKKDKESRAKSVSLGGETPLHDGERGATNGTANRSHEWENLPPPPPLPPRRFGEMRESISIDQAAVSNLPLPPPPPHPPSRDDDIFEGVGTDYVPTVRDNDSPKSEDMEESPGRDNERPYFGEHYGPMPPSQDLNPIWQHQATYDASVQGPAMPYASGEWTEYPQPPPEQYAGPWQPEQYPGYMEHYPTAAVANPEVQGDPHLMTQEEKDRGLGSVFKRDDQRLQQRRERDVREKDPNFISESYSECYPGYQEYNREIVGSDDDEDLTKMDMGGRAKGRLHRWDFESEDDWAKYNEQKEAMPKAAFQFGVKMQDGRKTRKQNKDQKLTNELHKINKILDRRKTGKGGGYENDDRGGYEEEGTPAKRSRA